LLPGPSDLVAVTIEGASVIENSGVDDGDELIDVGFYYGSESFAAARLIRYAQLKHSTRHAGSPWTASGLDKTIRGFATRYAKLRESFPEDDLAARLRFEFTTNRPIAADLAEALVDLRTGSAARHPAIEERLIAATTLALDVAGAFFRLFVADGGEPGLWAQRNLLTQDLSAYLPDSDFDAPVQLKELVTRKASTEFEADPSIRRHDVLRALKTTEDLLQPAPSLIVAPPAALVRSQEHEILTAVLSASTPVIIHADGGVGKSVLVARLATGTPAGSQAVLYDCFGDGLYRNALHYRHRHRDGLVQIANELAARGLCHPIIPAQADVKAYMRAFTHRLKQAVAVLRANDPAAVLCLIIDAADNAQMAARELGESGFVRDLVSAPLPEGVRLVLTARSHRREMLDAPPGAVQIELRPFDRQETGRHLRSVYTEATDAEVGEFAILSSSNPRVQALALSRGLTLQEMLQQLGPNPTTVDEAIGELLGHAIAELRAKFGPAEAEHIDRVCEALAVLRPLIPIAVLSELSGASESAVRSFALDLGRPLLVKGDSLHFLDEPAETWFRERFKPDGNALFGFLERLRPLCERSSYAAAAMPQLLLQAGRLDELVDLALSGTELPADPIACRDVELQRLIFAFKACLRQQRHLPAAKLALKAAGECAGEARQNTLLQENTDLAAALMSPDRIEEIVARRPFGGNWMGSHHAYDAGLMSAKVELESEAHSRLRMAIDWLRAWARRDGGRRDRETVDDADRSELTLAILRLRGAKPAAQFLRKWTWRPLALKGGRDVARRLLDTGRTDQIDALALGAGNDLWLILGLAVEARRVGYRLPEPAIRRALGLLADRRVQLPESTGYTDTWRVLESVTAIVEMSLRLGSGNTGDLAAILKRYLPAEPPRDLTDRFGGDHGPLLSAYALEATLRGVKPALNDLAPPEVRKQLERENSYGRDENTEAFLQNVGGTLAWYVLTAELLCGRRPDNLQAEIVSALEATGSAEARSYREGGRLWQTAALKWLAILRDTQGDEKAVATFRSWQAALKRPLWPDTLIALCRAAARAPNLDLLALDLAVSTFQILEGIREDAEQRATSFTMLARAIYTVSPAESAVYFNRAVEIASRVGEENIDRWAALLNLARAACEPEKAKPRTAYRLARVAELTYEYVARDKHFDWGTTIEALAGLCPSSSFAILSRWRDRRFGDQGRLLPKLIRQLVKAAVLPAWTPILFAGVQAEWRRIGDLESAVAGADTTERRASIIRTAYRYMRLSDTNPETWARLTKLAEAAGLDLPDLHRFAAAKSPEAKKPEATGPVMPAQPRRAPDWAVIFSGVDLTDPHQTRAANQAMRTYDPPYELDAFFREAFARAPVGKAPELVRAVAAWPDFEMFELRSLLNALPADQPLARALRQALKEAVLVACRCAPTHVHRRGRGAFIPFERLQRDGVVSDADVVQACLEGCEAQAEGQSPGGLFHAVDFLASSMTPVEAEEALNYGFDLLEETLEVDDGDGAWRAELRPPTSHLIALAGYIWAGLASPVAADRWEFAHVVRCAVEFGWLDLVEAIAGWGAKGHACGFVDARLEFYAWHARQWLALGLARGAHATPAGAAPALPLLKDWVVGPHVLVRALAARALGAMSDAVVPGAYGLPDLADVNRPAQPLKVTERYYEPVVDEPVDAEAVSDDRRYYFGIDIGPYWFAHLGRAFGLSEVSIERRARAKLTGEIGWMAGDWNRDERHKRNIFGDRETSHSHGSLPDTDDLRAYHGYHAMMLVAADLLQERQVWWHAAEAKNGFDDWLEDYLPARPDGEWVADRRDPRLVSEPPPPEGHDDKIWRWGVTANYLDGLLFTHEADLVVWGHWSGGPDDARETVSVRSAIVPRASAGSLLAALQTASDPDRFILPHYDDDDGLAAGRFNLRGWIVDHSHTSRLDDQDRWGEHLRYPGARPSGEVVGALKLQLSADQREWRAPAYGRLRTELWTQVRGYGRESETVAGWRTLADADWLRTFAGAYPDDQLIVSVAVRRDARRYSTGKAEFVEYPWPYERYYLIGDDGVPIAL
jgi:hypothetical protein